MRTPLTLVVLVLCTRLAHATCALAWWTNATDDPVPRTGSVFVYALHAEPTRPLIAWEGGTGTATLVALTPDITRIDYAGPDGARLVVRGDVGPVEFRLSAYTFPRTPRLVSITRARREWTCSGYDQLTIVLDAPAVAVHARWTRDGVTSEHWSVGDTTFELGALSCAGTTLPPSELDAGGSLSLSAVLVDGTEHALVEDVLVRGETVLAPVRAPWALIVALGLLVLAAGRAAFAPASDFARARLVSAWRRTGRACRRDRT